MSWQSYVDDQLVNTGFVSKAAITGLDGSMWASSAGFQVYLMAFVLTCTVNRWGRGWSDGRSVSRLPPIPASPFTLPVGMILSAGWDASLVAQAPAVHSLNPAETASIAAAAANPASVIGGGLTLCGVKYMVLRADDTAIYCRKGSDGACICRTNQCVLIGMYGENIQAGQCNTVVEKLGDYLRENNY